eukprot:1825489-Pleurochrysis_carterae.AAC.25
MLLATAISLVLVYFQFCPPEAFMAFHLCVSPSGLVPLCCLSYASLFDMNASDGEVIRRACANKGFLVVESCSIQY